MHVHFQGDFRLIIRFLLDDKKKCFYFIICYYFGLDCNYVPRKLKDDSH